MSEHYPIQILRYDRSAKRFEIELDKLKQIVEQNDVRDCSITIVSIAGAFRKGKSFMLSFFLRYLNETYLDNKSDWLGEESTQLSGFSWRGGSERHTTGIWVWSKIFTKTLPSGETIGVMLMDTQGTFDSNSTMSDNVTIFTLSTMLSSIQIYNLFNNIQEDDLQHLQLFTEYGKLAMRNSDAKPFQMLLFLVRDWSFPYEANYGFEGGRRILEKKLEVTANQAEELADVRKHIKACYDKLDCFLLPHPGRIATISQHFTGQLKDIDVEFKDMLKIFVPAILAPQNVLTKKINGQKIKAKNLITYIESYWDIFKRGGIPTAQTILGATAEANNLAAKEEANEYYTTEMSVHTAEGKPILEFSQMVEIHNTISKAALNLFREKAVLGEERVRNAHYQKLHNSLQNQLLFHLGTNESKKTKELGQTIDNLSTQIDSYKTTNVEQTNLMQSLKTQMEEYRKASDQEKQMLQQEIQRLREQMSSSKKGLCTIL